MSTLEHPPSGTDTETLREWLDLDLDGQLEGSERARLDRELEVRAEFGEERRRLVSLHAAFAESRVAVREGFQARVMGSLPIAGWEKSAGLVPTWILPLAMVVLLAAGAAWVLGGSTGLEETPILGTGLAVVDFLQATTLAGAGLLTASWRGLGLGLEELFAQSGLNLVALAVLVLFANLLFFNLLSRRRAVEAGAASRSTD